MGAVDVREQLLEGMSPRAQGMAEEFLASWEAGVVAVPELAGAAAEACLDLLRMPPRQRDAVLRRRWARLHGEPEPPAYDMLGRAMTPWPRPRHASVGERLGSAR